jgi:hypothetical protein
LGFKDKSLSPLGVLANLLDTCPWNYSWKRRLVVPWLDGTLKKRNKKAAPGWKPESWLFSLGKNKKRSYLFSVSWVRIKCAGGDVRLFGSRWWWWWWW